MPYAALYPDCDSVTDPAPADLHRLAAGMTLPGLTIFAWRHATLDEIDSFAPLARLPKLRRLVLDELRPADLDLAPILGMTHLQELELGGVPEFTLEHYARLSVALPQTTGRCLRPWFVIQGIGRCSKCKGQTVMLNALAPRARRYACLACDAKRLAAHVAR